MGSPCLTIAHALGEADPGDTILLAVGTYSGAGNAGVAIYQNDLSVDLNFVTISGPAVYTDASPALPLNANGGAPDDRSDPTPLTCDPAKEACIDASGFGTAFSIQADNVTIKGLTISGDTDTWALIEVAGDHDRWAVTYNALHTASQKKSGADNNHSYAIYADAQTTSGSDTQTGIEISYNEIFELGGQALGGANTTAGMGMRLEGIWGESAKCDAINRLECGAWIHNNKFNDLVVGQNQNNFDIDVNGKEESVAIAVVQDAQNTTPNRGVLITSNTYSHDDVVARAPDDNLSTGIIVGIGDTQVNEDNANFTSGEVDQFVVNDGRAATVNELLLAPFYKSLDTRIWGPGSDVYFRDDGTGDLAEDASESDATIVRLQFETRAADGAPPVGYPVVTAHKEYKLTVEAGGESASFKVSKDNDGDLNVREGARLLFDGAYTDLVSTDGVDQIVLIGTSGNDLLTVDFNNGNPIPLGQIHPPLAVVESGIDFQAGDGFDSMTLRGSEQVNDQTIEHTGVESGFVYFEPVATAGTLVKTTFADNSNLGFGATNRIKFDGLKPIDDLIIVNGTYTVIAQDDVDHEINVIDGPNRFGQKTFRISSGAVKTFEEINYANKKNVVIHGADDTGAPGNGDDVFTVFTEDGDAPDLMLSLTMHGGSLAADASQDFFVVRPSTDFTIAANGGTAENDYLFLDCANTSASCLPSLVTAILPADGSTTGAASFETVSWTGIEGDADILTQDIQIKKEVLGFAVNGAHPGDDLEFKVTITNAGVGTLDLNTATQDSLWVTDAIDHRLSLVEQSVIAEVGTVDLTSNRNMLWFITDESIASGESVSLTYKVIVNTLITTEDVSNWASILNPDASMPQYDGGNGATLEHYAKADLELNEVFGWPLKAAINTALFYETEAGPRYMVGLNGGAKDPSMFGMGAVLCRVPDTNQEVGWDGGLGNLWYTCGEGLPSNGGIPEPLIVTDLYLDSSDRIWLTSWGHSGLFYSDDGGQTWTDAQVDLSGGMGGSPDGIPDGFAQIYAISEDILGTLFISANNGDVYRSFDRGATWQKAKQLPMGSADTAFALEADPTLPGTLYAGTFGDSLYVTTDFGETWNRPDGNGLGSGYIFDIETDPQSGNLFVGTAQGIYYSPDGGDNWTGLNSAFPIPAVPPEVRNIAFDSNGAFFASTWGQGVWSSVDWQATALSEFALKNASVVNMTVADGMVNIFTTDGEVFRFAVDSGLSSVDVEDDVTQLPSSYSLEQNYPNPFNPTTSIAFSLPQSAQVNLTVYDVLGRQVATLVNGQLSAGQHSVQFEASSLPSGMYLYRLTTPAGSISQKMVLLK